MHASYFVTKASQARGRPGLPVPAPLLEQATAARKVAAMRNAIPEFGRLTRRVELVCPEESLPTGDFRRGPASRTVPRCTDLFGSETMRTVHYRWALSAFPAVNLPPLGL